MIQSLSNVAPFDRLALEAEDLGARVETRSTLGASSTSYKFKRLSPNTQEHEASGFLRNGPSGKPLGHRSGSSERHIQITSQQKNAREEFQR